MVKVFLDPGHGGSDPGAVANGLKEKDLNLDLALRTRDILLRDYAGVEVRLSRESDTSVSLQERVQAANAWGAHLFVSVHVNAGGGTGFESFLYRQDAAAHRDVIHDEIVKATQFRDRGRKVADFYVLRNAKMPSILTENGFIDHPEDVARLRDPNFRQKIAEAHARGLARALGLQPKPQPAPAQGTQGTVLYRVIIDGAQVGAFRERPNVLRAVERALDQEAQEVKLQKVIK